jgi:hypothetical protein
MNELNKVLNDTMLSMDKRWKRESEMNKFVKEQGFPMIICLRGTHYNLKPLVGKELLIFPASTSTSLFTGKETKLKERVVFEHSHIGANTKYYFRLAGKRTINKVDEIDAEIKKLYDKKKRVLKKAFITAKPLTEKKARYWHKMKQEVMRKFGLKN